MRGYDDPCGIARALGVVGEKWALLVVRELLFGPKRFTDLRRGLTGISENVLSQRLRELEGAEIVRRRRFAPSSTSAYELTERGRALEPVLTAIRHWGAELPVDGTDPDLGVDALVFALKSTFDTELADGLEAVVQLDVGHDRFRVEVSQGRLGIARGEVADPDAVIIADAPTLQSLAFADRRLPEAEQAGEVALSGDREAAERLLNCFPVSDRS
jgi:DNA-binding HxlR family transcriptional regulator